ncbi:MAG: hypothetical protein JNM86_01395 [Phycisphaerae bacterium]|nr:hypothetical protein [Phycisphaerae bacterium]
MAKKKSNLDLSKLNGGSPPGISPALGQFAAEAAGVLLEHNKHKAGVEMRVLASAPTRYEISWAGLHASARTTHKDLPAAVEYGAYGIAFLLVEEFTTLKVIERSAKKTGIDYWLGTGKEPLFQATARLEVSGIVNGEDKVDERVKDKMKQSDRSKGKLPAFIAVVEFGQPMCVFKKR